MIDKHLSFALPKPWEGETFETRQIGTINYLVGPNGSGKAQFASELIKHLEKSRLLSTDRLKGMEQSTALNQHITGDVFSQGFSKNFFLILERQASKGLELTR